jgi:ABC-type multidrug transport system fused ATPase/permease subunit
MQETGRKVAALIGPGQRSRWLLVVVMAVVVSLAEAGSTLMMFALLGVLVGDAGELTVPVLGDVRAYLPWEGTELLAALGLATAVVFVGRSVLILTQQYVQFRVAENAGARLSTRLLAGYLTMPYEFHLQRNSSELVRNAFDSVRRFVAEGLMPGVQVVGKGAIVVGVLVVLVASSPLTTLFAVAALAPLTWGVLRAVHPRVKRLGRTAQTMVQHNLQSLQQSLHGVRDISVLGREAAFVDAYRRDRRELARAQYLRKTAAQAPRVAIETGLVVFIVAFVWVAALAEGGVDQALPLLGLFGYAAARLMPELQQITKSLNQLKFVGPAIDDIHDDLATFAGQADTTGQPAQPLPFDEALVADQVSYRYPSAETDALIDVDLEIRPGESVGVIGPTGGGKSTLVDVLLGLLAPTSGQVTVDGVNLHANARAWQANVGVVPQMVFLVDDTLRANIALGVPPDEIDEEALAEAVSMAQLDEFAASLPVGLDTVVGERGVRVSGGQRQRLATARALYRRPSVLIFDEGTSALDNDTEAALMGALERLRGTRTLITVAHRLTTVEDCDNVLLVRDGRVFDRGPFAELAARNPELQRAGTLSGPT